VEKKQGLQRFYVNSEDRFSRSGVVFPEGVVGGGGEGGVFPTFTANPGLHLLEDKIFRG